MSTFLTHPFSGRLAAQLGPDVKEHLIAEHLMSARARNLDHRSSKMQFDRLLYRVVIREDQGLF